MTAMRKFSRTLAANESVVINVSKATAVQCTSATALFDIKPDDQNPVELANGLGVRYELTEAFDTLRIVNRSTPQTVELYIGNGDVVDNRLSASGTLSTRTLAAQSANYGSVSVGVAATLVLAANTGRSNILLQNLGTGVIYVGTDNAVTVANGIEVQVGGAITLATDEAIYAISTIAATDVRYLEEVA